MARSPHRAARGHRSESWTPLCQIVADEIGVPFEAFISSRGQWIVALRSCRPTALVTWSQWQHRPQSGPKARQMLLDWPPKSSRSPARNSRHQRWHDLCQSRPRQVQVSPKVVAKRCPCTARAHFGPSRPSSLAWHNQGIGPGQRNRAAALCRQAHFMEVEVDPTPAGGCDPRVN